MYCSNILPEESACTKLILNGFFTESSTKLLLKVKFPFLLSGAAPNSLDYFTEDIGKTIFLSLEEAEEEIKRRYKPNDEIRRYQ